MAYAYARIYIQCIIAVRFHRCLIEPGWKEQLHQHITEVVQNNKHSVIAVNSMPDHLHLFFCMHPGQSLTNLMRIVKAESTEWINKQQFTRSPFKWQSGYGSFSYEHSQVKAVAESIIHQEEHHRKKTFLKEYECMLNQIGPEKKYIFKPLV